jgi:hypothetical protein
MAEGVDYAWARPGGAALQVAGKRFAVRYVPYEGDGGKGLGLAELADLRTARTINGIKYPPLSIALVWETTAGRALEGGWAGGNNDARYALGSIAKFNFGSTIPIYFAVDVDAQSWQQPALDSYLRGAISVLGLARVGVYGSYQVLNRCRANGVARWFWLTYAWSYGQINPFAHLYQYRNTVYIGGQEVDLTRGLQSDYGQWPRPVYLSDTSEPIPTTAPSMETWQVELRYRPASGTVQVRAGKPWRRKATVAQTPDGYFKLATKVRVLGRFDLTGSYDTWYLVDWYRGNGNGQGIVTSVDFA